MAQWNRNTVPKCDVGKCSDEVLTMVERTGYDRKLYRRVIDMSEVYDRATKAWFSSHICQQTTVCRCEKCGLFYKPSLGHKCKAKE